MSPKSNHYYDLPFKYYIKLHQLLVVHCEKKNPRKLRASFQQQTDENFGSTVQSASANSLFIQAQ